MNRRSTSSAPPPPDSSRNREGGSGSYRILHGRERKVVAPPEPRAAEATALFPEIGELTPALATDPGVIALVRALKAEVEALRRAKEEAEQANAAKTAFVSRVSQELRAPLNAILGFAQVMDLASDLGPRHRERVRQILTAGRHLAELTAEVLDLAKIEADALALSPEPVAVDGVLAEVVAGARLDAARRGIVINVDSKSTAGFEVLADRQRLAQVLTSLVSNAVKFNQESGRVDIRCEPMRGQRLKIFVRDTGVGLSDEQKARLFLPFERLGAEKSGVGGTGLGLVLAQRLMGLMDGGVSVESAVGVGSTFCVDLPCVRRPTPGFARIRIEREVAVESRVGLARSYPKILVIERDASNARLVEDILSTCCDARLLFSVSGIEGVALARAQRPALILLDWTLPNREAEAALRELSTAPELKGIPVVVLSHDPTPSAVERILEAGAWAHLAKPIVVADLLDTIDDFVSPSSLPPERDP